MRMTALTACSLAAVLTVGPLRGAQAACSVHSGPTTAALVELYTSEGCSSCPPADHTFNALRQRLGPEAQVVPLALHVTYWDELGWKDPFADPAFGQRQSMLVRQNGQRTVYTPQFFVDGKELRGWRSDLAERIRAINAMPAAAALRIAAHPLPDGRLAIETRAVIKPGIRESSGTLYVAVAESGLVSQVARGENGGATLHHDHVVRAWAGPIALADGAVEWKQTIPLPASWRRDRLEVTAFVQDPQSGRVLQALSAAQCAAS